MSTSPSKNNILKKIRAALTHSTRLPFPGSEGSDSPFQSLQQDIVVEFAEQFTQLGGQFDYCANEGELRTHFEELCYQSSFSAIYCNDEKLRRLLPLTKWHSDIASCHAAITTCEALVARTGSIVLSTHNGGRVASVYTPVHVCVAYTSQLVYHIKEALVNIKQKYGGTLPSLITLATGPSRTADIEKTLVVGVHGPKQVFLFLVDDLNQAS
jgi:L-lactate dehydrogenase complex protein LldG